MSKSEPFTSMATRIDHNTESKFGGAYVILPPGIDIPPLEVLILDAQEDPRNFFMVLQAKVAALIEQIDQAERNRMGGFGR